ncbi:MAG TPA: hypothetical protein VLA43_10700 [Longimicrobiales bacterium]|nr:hypothetical protein [Longimicrobiales bacterium]
MYNILIAALGLGLAACGADDPGSAGPLPPAPDTLVVSADAELRELAQAILPDLAARSGLSLREPVRLERRSRAELEGYLRVKLDEELPEERARHLTAVYSRLGLMSGEEDLRALLLSVYREQVAGFYDPDSTALFVMDDQSAQALEPVLLHELVHAVQDQWADLDAATARENGNDRATAAQAAIEGHATLVMLEYMAEQVQGRDLDLTEIPGFAGQMRAVLEMARSQYPELARAPRVIQEGMLFPYMEGAGFVLEVWRARGTRAGSFDALLPSSTEQVLDPARFLGDPPDDPSALRVEPADGTVLYRDGLGALETRILLEEVVGPAAGAAVVGWDGDAYVLVEAADGGLHLAWASVWDDVAARDRFLEALAPGLGALPGPATLTPLVVGGRPGALLVVGGPLEVHVSLAEGA